MSPAATTAHYPALHSHLNTLLPTTPRPALTTSVLPTLLHSIARIASALRSAHQVSQVGTANAFGDDQLNVDILAERIIREAIAECSAIVAGSSEEDPVERSAGGGGEGDGGEGEERYTVAFDPLDGSSIIAPNWTVGTIVGVWDGASAVGKRPDGGLVAAVLGVLGPRTTAVVAVRVPGGGPGVCFEVGLGEKADGEVMCEIVRERVEMLPPPFTTRYFAPANLRAAAEDEAYRALIDRYVREKCTLRYSGGLVPDVVHMLVKGQGVYVSPVTGTSKAKLRRLYELAPVALIVECAGGSALDPATGRRILEEAIGDTDERGGLVCGSREEVEIVKQAFGLH